MQSHCVQVALSSWHELLVQPLQRQLFDALMILFAAERSGSFVPRALIRNVMQSYGIKP